MRHFYKKLYFNPGLQVIFDITVLLTQVLMEGERGVLQLRIQNSIGLLFLLKLARFGTEVLDIMLGMEELSVHEQGIKILCTYAEYSYEGENGWCVETCPKSLIPHSTSYCRHWHILIKSCREILNFKPCWSTCPGQSCLCSQAVVLTSVCTNNVFSHRSLSSLLQRITTSSRMARSIYYL